MKKGIWLTLVLGLFTLGLSAQITWLTIDEALTLQKENPKKILVDVYTHWCGPCKMLKEKTFSDARVIEYVNKHFYAVGFDAEQPEALTFKGKDYSNPDHVPGKVGRNGVHQFARFLGVAAYPTLIFLDEQAEIIDRSVGFKVPIQIEPNLKFVGDGVYKTHNTPEKRASWEGTFEGSWK